MSRRQLDFQGLQETYDRIDAAIVRWLGRWSVPVLRVSLGIVFLWFGALKLAPGLSPAEALATDTIRLMSFGLVEGSGVGVALGVVEVLIGLSLAFGFALRLTLLALLVQMIGTFAPLLLFPILTFTLPPYAPTMEGQYILKNLVLVAAALVIGSSVRPRRAPEPSAEQA
ncbi:MAG: DoxX family membrane protein [Fimbriimonadaceae bacterium]